MRDDLERGAVLLWRASTCRHRDRSISRAADHPAAIVETICGLSLAWGAIAVFGQSALLWRTALIGNVVALGGILLGMAALAAGRGPRTASNDMNHHIMLALVGVALLILFFARSALNRS